MTTRKQRVRQALNHQTPDRVPVDFGSTAVTGVHVACVAQLRDHFGLAKRPVKICEPYQMLGEIEPDLLEAMGIDTQPLPSPKTIFGFRNENWREFRTPWGQDVLVSQPAREYLDLWVSPLFSHDGAPTTHANPTHSPRALAP